MQEVIDEVDVSNKQRINEQDRFFRNYLPNVHARYIKEFEQAISSIDGSHFELLAFLGPPGTGKTSFVHFEVSKRFRFCAYSDVNDFCLNKKIAKIEQLLDVFIKLLLDSFSNVLPNDIGKQLSCLKAERKDRRDLRSRCKALKKISSYLNNGEDCVLVIDEFDGLFSQNVYTLSKLKNKINNTVANVILSSVVQYFPKMVLILVSNSDELCNQLTENMERIKTTLDLNIKHEHGAFKYKLNTIKFDSYSFAALTTLADFYGIEIIKGSSHELGLRKIAKQSGDCREMLTYLFCHSELVSDSNVSTEATVDGLDVMKSIFNKLLNSKIENYLNAIEKLPTEVHILLGAIFYVAVSSDDVNSMIREPQLLRVYRDFCEDSRKISESLVKVREHLSTLKSLNMVKLHGEDALSRQNSNPKIKTNLTPLIKKSMLSPVSALSNKNDQIGIGKYFCPKHFVVCLFSLEEILMLRKRLAQRFIFFSNLEFPF